MIIDYNGFLVYKSKVQDTFVYYRGDLKSLNLVNTYNLPIMNILFLFTLF